MYSINPAHLAFLDVPPCTIGDRRFASANVLVNWLFNEFRMLLIVIIILERLICVEIFDTIND